MVVSRDGCSLCGAMLDDLAELAAQVPLPTWTTVDVDADPDWVRRYGLKVPVLLLDGVPVCHFSLDRGELSRLFRPR